MLSGADSNLNGDTAADRTILNPNGVRGTASTVTPLLKTCTSFDVDGSCLQTDSQRTVGYLAILVLIGFIVFPLTKFNLNIYFFQFYHNIPSQLT